jgi:hypothetical protein
VSQVARLPVIVEPPGYSARGVTVRSLGRSHDTVSQLDMDRADDHTHAKRPPLPPGPIAWMERRCWRARSLARVASPAISDQTPRAGRPRTGEGLSVAGGPLRFQHPNGVAPAAAATREPRRSASSRWKATSAALGAPSQGDGCTAETRGTSPVPVEWRRDLAMLNRYRPSGYFLQIRPGQRLEQRAKHAGDRPKPGTSGGDVAGLLQCAGRGVAGCRAKWQTSAVL